MGGGPGVEKTIQDSFVDLATGIYRRVWTDAATGKVLDASAYDGGYLYTSRSTPEGPVSSPLTLYRTPQSLDKVADLMPGGSSIDPENTFDAIRQQADVRQVTQQTWTDGRKVYVLRAKLPAGAALKYKVDTLNGETVMVFDAQTYDLLENEVVMQKDGQEVVLTSYRKLADELLPAGSPVAWDLSDLQGVTMVDDPSAQHNDLLPEVITPQELAAHTQTGYLLKTVPAGFTLEISAPPVQKNEPVFFYIAAYRTAENDYFVLQSGKAPEALANLGQDSYQAESGLTIYFLPAVKDAKGKDYILAIAAAPDGTQFTISSTLSKESVEKLADDLVLVK